MYRSVYRRECDFLIEPGRRDAIMTRACISDDPSETPYITIDKWVFDDTQPSTVGDIIEGGIYITETEARTLITQLQRALFAIEDAQMEVE